MCRRSGPDRGTSLRTPRCVPRMTGSDDQRPTTNGTLAQPVQKRSGTEASHLDPTIRQVVLVAKAEPEGSAGNRDRSTSARRHVRTARAKHRREARCKAPGRTSPRGLPFRLLRTRRCLRSGGVPGYRSSLRAGASDVAQQARFGVGGSRKRSKLRLDYTADLASRKHDGNRFPSVSLHRRRLRDCDAASPWPVVTGFAASLPLSCAGPWSASSGITPGRSACFRFTHCWAIRSRRKPLSLLAARPILRLAPLNERLRFGTVSTGDVVANHIRSDSPSRAPFALAVTRWTSTVSGFARET
jgi:hypothetical protein